MLGKRNDYLRAPNTAVAHTFDRKVCLHMMPCSCDLIPRVCLKYVPPYHSCGFKFLQFKFTLPESIELFTEDQAFSPSYDISPPQVPGVCISEPPLWLHIPGV